MNSVGKMTVCYLRASEKFKNVLLTKREKWRKDGITLSFRTARSTYLLESIVDFLLLVQVAERAHTPLVAAVERLA